MVSPAILRKPNQEKVKRILSKGTKHDNWTRNDPKPGLKPVQKHRDQNIGKHVKITSNGLVEGTNERMPDKTIAIASNKEKHAYQLEFYGSDTRSRDFERSVPYSGYGDPSQFLPPQHPSSFQLTPQQPNDMQKSRGCDDASLFSVRGATISNAHGSAKYISPWNKAHHTNIQTPADSDVNITGTSPSSPAFNEMYDINTQASTLPNIDITESSRPKRKRGKTKGHKLAKLLDEGQRFEIMFPTHVNRPVGKYSTEFTTEIGVLVRQIAPLQAKSWSGVHQEKKDQIMARLREKFKFSKEPPVIESIGKSMAKSYSSWRSRIHEEFLKYSTAAAAVINPPPLNIKMLDWVYLCNLFDTDEYKAISEKNRKNREKLRAPHTAGTKAFSKIRYDKRNPTTQADFDFIDLYEDTHTTDGLWVHENAKKFHGSLKDHRSKAEMEGTNLTDEQLSVLTFGRKPYYISGLGRGPKPTSSATGKKTRAQLEREASESLERAEAAEKEVIEARKMSAELAERVKTLESQHIDFSAKLREEMSSQFATMQKQMFETSMREQFYNMMEKRDKDIDSGFRCGAAPR